MEAPEEPQSERPIDYTGTINLLTLAQQVFPGKPKYLDADAQDVLSKLADEIALRGENKIPGML